MTVNPTRYNDEIDPTATDHQSTMAADWPQVIANQQWTPDNPPMIADRFYKSIVPVQSTPSDRIACYTYTPLTTDQPQRLVGRQQEGLGCRVRIQNLGAAASDAAISNGNESFGVLLTAGVRTYYANAFLLPGGATILPPLVIETRDEVWLIAVAGTPVVSVMVETYDLNS